MANIDFGENLGLRLQNEKIFNIAYSFDGKYLAVDVGKETVIFENACLRKNDFKEIRRVRGSLLDCESCPFSMDGQQILTIIGKRSKLEKEGSEEDDEDDEGEENYEEEVEEEGHEKK